MREKKEGVVTGVRIRTFNTWMIVLSCVLYGLLIFTTASMSLRYRQLTDHTNAYMECEKAASMVTEASDYLTEQVRLYVQDMDLKYMTAYFEEANVTCRREKALEELESQKPEEDILESLETALMYSRDLMEREIYAMKLISQANSYPEEMLAQEVRDMPLKAADRQLTPQEMIEKARTLVFDEGYQNAKALIYSYLSRFTEGVTGMVRGKQETSMSVLSDTLVLQRVLLSLLFVMSIVNFAVITILIVKPLSIHIKRIKDNKALEIVGSYEFKYLALTYNDIYELKAANESMLIRKAEHDPLTGLLNRGAFNDLKDLLKDGFMPIVLAVVDVDMFKEVNDQYGHETGDQVLKNVADLLKTSFRSGDYVIRLGGDEFVVLLTDVAEADVGIVQRKMANINATLSHPEDGTPAVSLSVGVARSAHGFSDDLFEKADQALYSVKRSGRGSCRVSDSEIRKE